MTSSPEKTAEAESSVAGNRLRQESGRGRASSFAYRPTAVLPVLISMHVTSSGRAESPRLSADLISIKQQAQPRLICINLHLLALAHLWAGRGG